MNKYNVYKHPILGYEAIKQGFSWPAFFFTWIWAFVKKLWVQGAVLLLATLFLQGFITEIDGDTPTFIFIFAGIPIILFSIFGPSVIAGVLGNAWRESSMADRGFKFLGTAEAGAPDGALAVASDPDGMPAILVETQTKAFPYPLAVFAMTLFFFLGVAILYHWLFSPFQDTRLVEPIAGFIYFLIVIKLGLVAKLIKIKPHANIRSTLLFYTKWLSLMFLMLIIGGVISELI